MENASAPGTTGHTEVGKDSQQAYTGTGSKGTWSFWLVGFLLVGMLIWTVWKVMESGPVTAAEREDSSFKVKLFTSFNMDTCLIPKDEIRGGGPKKDGIPALVDPPVISGRDVQKVNEEMHGKYLVSGDRVLGIELNGESRAYPLSIVIWHEIVNDTVGGVPIAVTY